MTRDYPGACANTDNAVIAAPATRMPKASSQDLTIGKVANATTLQTHYTAQSTASTDMSLLTLKPASQPEFHTTLIVDGARGFAKIPIFALLGLR